MTKPMTVQSYVFFDGRCEEALQFYGRALDATVTFLMRNKESPDPHPPGMLPPGSENKIMHAQLRSPSGFVLMGSDTPASMGAPRDNGTISLSGDDDGELRGYWQKLSQGGTVAMPLAKAPWGDSFGMLADKFGVSWMVNISGPKA